MEMLQCRFILASLLVLNGCFFEASCQSVSTYTSRDAESLACNITEETPTVTWTEILVGNSVTVLTYQAGNTPTLSMEEKYRNFNYTLEPTSFNLIIMNVGEEDGGVYVCTPFGVDPTTYDVIVEVLAKPTIQYESQDIVELEVIVGTSHNLTCSATGARSVSDLSLMWDPSFVEKSPLVITPNGEYKDYSITSTYTAVKGDSSITCQFTGYVMQDEIDDQRMENISHIVNVTVQYAPVCNLNIHEGDDCREVTLTCECDAVPAVIYQYSFFNESILMNNGTSNTFTVNVAYETSYRFSCSATNSIDSGENSDEKVYDCNKGTTVLPTTTTVTTASLSTNEPTRTKATEPTTEEPPTTNTNKPEDGLPIWAIILIIAAALGGCVCGVMIIICLCKTGKSTKPSNDKPDNNGAGPEVDTEITAYEVIDNSNSGDGIENDGKETEMNTKSDKSDNNGAGPGVDPEIPTYGTNDNSPVTDGNVTATNSKITSSEPATAPVYGEVKKDRKKKSSNSGDGIENDGMETEMNTKSDKSDNNGAGPGVDPEIPTYGTCDKNMTKDQAPAPHSSMRDSTNSSKPKQDMEMQYADLDHGNNPPSDEVRKPKEKPTEYAAVQHVIV